MAYEDEVAAHLARIEAGEVYVSNGPYGTMSDYWTHGVTWSDGWGGVFRSRGEADAIAAKFPAPLPAPPSPGAG